MRVRGHNAGAGAALLAVAWALNGDGRQVAGDEIVRVIFVPGAAAFVLFFLTERFEGGGGAEVGARKCWAWSREVSSVGAIAVGFS